MQFRFSPAAVSPRSCSTRGSSDLTEASHQTLVSSVCKFQWGWKQSSSCSAAVVLGSLSWRQNDIWRGSVAPGRVSHRPEAQPVSINPWEGEVMHERGDWKGLLPWFMTRCSYGIPPARGWVLLQRDTEAPSANSGLRFQPFTGGHFSIQKEKCNEKSWKGIFSSTTCR